MQAHRPWRPCSPPAVATRVQTEHARPTTFARPTPTAATAAPLPTHFPTPFCEPRPTVRPFPTGRDYRSAPLAPSSPLPPRKAANGAQPFSPFSAPILYIRARRGLFLPSAGGDRCALRRKNGKAGRNTREGGHFLHTVEKTVENKLWISGKSARFFHRSATNGGEAANGARAAGRPTAKAQCEAPQSSTRGGESKH